MSKNNPEQQPNTVKIARCPKCEGIVKLCVTDSLDRAEDIAFERLKRKYKCKLSFVNADGIEKEKFCLMNHHTEENFIKKLADAKNAAERSVIEEALEAASHSKTLAAKMLGIDRKTLYNKCSALGIEC